MMGLDKVEDIVETAGFVGAANVIDEFGLGTWDEPSKYNFFVLADGGHFFGGLKYLKGMISLLIFFLAAKKH